MTNTFAEDNPMPVETDAALQAELNAACYAGAEAEVQRLRAELKRIRQTHHRIDGALDVLTALSSREERENAASVIRRWLGIDNEEAASAAR